jgi:hypothetical protein
VNSFRHSGKLGDIIYSLPAVKALGGGIFYVDPVTEYLGKPPLGRDSAQLMVELLKTQDYIQHAELYGYQPVTHDLDRFRDRAIPAHIFNSIKAETGKIAGFMLGGFVQELGARMIPTVEINLLQFHWQSVGLPGHADPNTPWITGLDKKRIADIVISRTGRYSGSFDWSGARQYARRSVFVGLEEEWQEFRSAYFDVEFYKVSSLVDFARVVAGAKLFMGNQSFGLALASAMLVPAVAELCGPNPISISPVNGHRVLDQNLVEAYIS